MTTLKHQTVSGVKWIVGSSFLQKGIQIASTVVLARILGPSEFGLFALAFVAIDALGLFKSMGFDSALIQRKDDVEKAANTAFFIIPVLGIIIYLLLALSAPWVGKFLNNQSVVNIIQTLGIIFVISCFGKVPGSLLERSMLFSKVSIIEISTAIIYSASAIIFALLGMGVWSLVFAYILKTVNQNILSFYYCKWRPKFEFDGKIAVEMFNFGKFLFLSGIVWFLKMNMDNILVGKTIGVTALGLYAIAFNIANVGSEYFSSKVYRVIYPAYSKIQHDLSSLRYACLKTLKYTAIIIIPLGITLYLLSNYIIMLLYGPMWASAAPALRILVWAGIFNSLPLAFGGALMALGYSKPTFWVNSLQVFLYLVLMPTLASHLGIIGVSLVVSFTSIIGFVAGAVWSMKILSLRLYDIYTSLKPALKVSALIFVCLLFFKKAISGSNSIYPIASSVVMLLVAFFVYCTALIIVQKNIIKNMTQLFTIKLKGYHT